MAEENVFYEKENANSHNTENMTKDSNIKEKLR